MEFKCGALCLDVVQPRFHIQTYMQTYVAGIWLLELKLRAGRVRSRVTGEVVTEIACGRKRQSKHRGREIFLKAWPVLTLEYKTHVKMERPSQSTTCLALSCWWDDWLGEEFLLLHRERATGGQWETSGVFHVVAWVLLSVSTPHKTTGLPSSCFKMTVSGLWWSSIQQICQQ